MADLVKHITNGVYLICGQDGQVSEVLYDDMQLSKAKSPPFAFMELIAKESLNKASDFWQDIRTREIVFDYELYVKADKEPIPLKFTSARFGDKIWVIGAMESEIMEKMFDEMMLINNEQQNLIRRSEKKISEFQKQKEVPSSSVFNEISEMNNELVNTQRKLIKQNEEILRLNKSLKESNRELQHFAYTLSHDLKEPLRMVRSFMSLLEKKYGADLDEKAMEYIHYAVDGAERMNGLITDLLEYSRIGRQNNTYEKIDLNKILQKVLKLNESMIKEADAKIEVDNLPEIEVQTVPIERLFNNLLGNSLKYRKPDVSPVISIKAQEQAGHWLFSVTDNGRGIPADLHTSIFDLFKRGGNNEGISGSGMGLAMCKKIVNEHSGEIWVSSEPGKGSTFYFTIQKNLRDR